MKKILAMLLAAAMVISMLTVVAFAQGTGTDDETEDVGDETPAVDAPADDEPAADAPATEAPAPDVSAPAEDNNPSTGVALAALPAMIAAAAAAVTKRH